MKQKSLTNRFETFWLFFFSGIGILLVQMQSGKHQNPIVCLRGRLHLQYI